MRTPSAEMPMGFVLLLPIDKLDFDVFVIIFEQPGKLNTDCFAKGFVFNILD